MADISVNIGVTGSAIADVDALQEKLNALESKKFKINVGLNGATDRFFSKIESLKTSLESLGNVNLDNLNNLNVLSTGVLSKASEFKALADAIKTLNAAQKESAKKNSGTYTKQFNFNSMEKQVDNMSQKLKVFQEKIRELNGKGMDTSDATQKLKELTAAIEEFKDYTSGDSMNKSDAREMFYGVKNAASELQGELNGLNQAYKTNTSLERESQKAANETAKAVRKESKVFTELEKSRTLQAKISNILDTNSAAVGNYRTELEALQTKLSGAMGDANINKEVSASLTRLTTEMKSAETEAVSLGSALKQALGGTVLGGIAKAGLGYAVRELRQVVREGLQSAVEIESALAQIQVVTGASGAELDTFFSSAADSARNLGVEVKDMLGSIETFSRLGYELQDSLDLSNAATMLGNVANTTVDAATTGLTSIIKGYGMAASDGEHVADVITKIGKTLPI